MLAMHESYNACSICGRSIGLHVTKRSTTITIETEHNYIFGHRVQMYSGTVVHYGTVLYCTIMYYCTIFDAGFHGPGADVGRARPTSWPT